MRDDIILKLQRIIEGNDRITWDLFPAIYDGFLEADELSMAEDRMLRFVASAIQTCTNDKIISTASSDKIAEYEDEFGLSGDGLTLDERRQQVIDYINRSRVMNEDTLHTLVQSLLDGYTAYEKTDPQALTLGIFTTDEDEQGELPAVEVVPKIRPVVPQNLELYAGVDASFERPTVVSHANLTALWASMGIVHRQELLGYIVGGTVTDVSEHKIYARDTGGLLVPGGYAYSDGALLDMEWDFGGVVEEYNRPIDLVLAVRYDPSTSQWLSKTFPSDNYWWWSGIISNQEEADLLAFGLSICETVDQSMANAGPIGALKYDPAFDYSIEKFYSGMGETEVTFDKSNFYLGPCESGYTEISQLLDCVVIHNVLQYNTNIKTYGIKATPGGNRNNIMYTAQDRSVVTVSSTWSPLYRRDGVTVKYTGSLPIIIGYFTSTSTYALTTTNISEWSFRNNNGVLEVSCSGNRSANRVVVQWDEEQNSIVLDLGLRWSDDSGSSSGSWRSVQLNDWWYGGFLTQADKDKADAFGLETGSFGKAGPIGSFLMDYGCVYTILAIYTDVVDGKGSGTITFDPANFYCSPGNKFGLRNWIIFDYISSMSDSAKAFRLQIKRVYPSLEKKVAYVSPDKTAISVGGNDSKYLYDESGNYIPYNSANDYYEYSYTNNGYNPPWYQTGGGFLIVQKGQYLGVIYYRYGFSEGLSSLEYVEIPK